MDGKAAPSRQLIQADKVKQLRCACKVNVKHGDYLRTLGGAMTAQCKVLHLLFSQSDYPKIFKCHIIQSVYVCVITERLWWWSPRHDTVMKSYFVCVFLIPGHVSFLHGDGLLLDIMPKSTS